MILEILMYTLGCAVIGTAFAFVLFLGVLAVGAFYSSISDFPFHLLDSENDTTTDEVSA